MRDQLVARPAQTHTRCDGTPDLSYQEKKRMFIRIKRRSAIALVVTLLCAFAHFTRVATATTISSFDDIIYWVGSGTNSAALVVDWNDGKSAESLAWGYRWSGTATGFDMISAVLASDPRFEGAFIFGTAIFGLGYDLDGDGGTFNFIEPGGGPSDPDDHFQVGFFVNGYWSYWIHGGEFVYDIYDNNPPFNLIGTGTYSVPGTPQYSNVNWFFSPVGAADRPLINGAWDGWRFAPGFVAQSPSQPVAAIPEPSTWVFLVAGGSLVWIAARHRIRI